ncbi:MAG: CheY-like chemotaxis protein [Vicingaceae bacterium]|jgi:CheY-like chemotaxis protein
MKILLIDDSQAINEMNAYFFRKSMNNVEIETAKNGKEALAIIENPDSKLPDLILLDLKMPVFDGYEFLEYLNSIEFTYKDHLNVILLTTSMNPEDKTRILKFKFVSNYLIKPLTIDKANNIVLGYQKTL